MNANALDENWSNMQPVGFDPSPHDDYLIHIDDKRIVRLGTGIHAAIEASGYVVVPSVMRNDTVNKIVLRVVRMTPAEQFNLAFKVAENIGYIVVPREPPDWIVKLVDDTHQRAIAKDVWQTMIEAALDQPLGKLP